MKRKNTDTQNEKSKKGAIYTHEHADLRNSANKAAYIAQQRLKGKKLVRINARTWVYQDVEI